MMAGSGVSRSSNTCTTFGYLVISFYVLGNINKRRSKTYMRVIPHDSKLSPYLHEPVRIRVVPPPLVSIWWRIKYLGGQGLPISCLDDLQDLTKCSHSNSFDHVVDEPVTRSWSLARCLSRRPAVQAERLNARRVDLTPLSCSLALLHKRPQVLDVARGPRYVVGELNPDGEAAAVDRRLFESVRSAGRICQEPRLLPPHFLLVQAVLADCGAVRRVVIVKPDVQSLVHSDIALNFYLSRDQA